MGVEVAGDDGGELVELAALEEVDHRVGAADPGRLALVVEVGVDHRELGAGGEIAQPRPDHDTGDGVAPGGRADHVGGVGEPELVPLEHLEAGAVVEDRGVLAGTAALTAVADAAVSRQGGLDRGQLPVQGLLDAEQGGLLPLEQLDQQRPTGRPVIGVALHGATARGAVVADVEAHHVELVALRAADQRSGGVLRGCGARRGGGRGESGASGGGAEAGEDGATGRGDGHGALLGSGSGPRPTVTPNSEVTRGFARFRAGLHRVDARRPWSSWHRRRAADARRGARRAADAPS